MITKTPQYNTKLFNEVWTEYSSFKTDLDASIFNSSITDINKEILYYLLLGRYSNNPIANLDLNQFKNKLFSIIFQYGPTWEKRLDIQSKLRNLTDEEITSGSKAIFNHALNPGTEPGTAYLEELTQINEQNTTKYKKAKIDGYALLWELLKTDVTNEFLGKFKICFKQFVEPENPLLYITEEN